MEILTSPHNPRIKAWAALKDKKGRDKTDLYLVEGLRTVQTYLDCGAPIQEILFDSFSTQSQMVLDLVDVCEGQGLPTFELTSAMLKHVADTDHPQGILAVVALPHHDLDLVLGERADAIGLVEGGEPTCRNVVLIADGIRDPGNLGTMIRSADAVGARAVMVTDGSVDVFNPKVVRSAMGSLAHVPVLRVTAEDAALRLAQHGYRILCAEADAPQSLFAVDLRGQIAVAIGGETMGLSDPLREHAKEYLALPMPGQTESLNAGMAATAVLYEALRQRMS